MMTQRAPAGANNFLSIGDTNEFKTRKKLKKLNNVHIVGHFNSIFKGRVSLNVFILS